MNQKIGAYSAAVDLIALVCFALCMALGFDSSG